MEFMRGDLVHYGSVIAIVVDVDSKRRRYCLQLDSKGEVIKWADEKEVK